MTMVVFSSFWHENETKTNNNQQSFGKQRIENEKSEKNNVSSPFFLVFNTTLRKKSIFNKIRWNATKKHLPSIKQSNNQQQGQSDANTWSAGSRPCAATQYCSEIPHCGVGEVDCWVFCVLDAAAWLQVEFFIRRYSIVPEATIPVRYDQNRYRTILYGTIVCRKIRYR